MWNETAVTRRLGIRFPIVQGPFGGGLSSPQLVAAVSNAGGLGSFGAQGLSPERITAIVEEIRALTDAPFAVNLWVSTEDDDAAGITEARVNQALAALAPFYDELGVAPPPFPPRSWPTFDVQVAALLEARPPVFSFVFGVPPASVIEACRGRGIVTIGAATTVSEAAMLDRGGVDLIVATGFEAGGHRPSFLEPAERSLMGTLALVPQVVDAVKATVIAAGGIADGRGIAAALALGAEGVQIGTAFLACEESNAPPLHRDALHGQPAGVTMLTRAFSGRLARGVRNRLGEAFADPAVHLLPYPLQGQLVGALREEALRRGRTDLITLWGGQSAPLLRHRRAAELFDALVAGTEEALQRAVDRSTGSIRSTGVGLPSRSSVTR